MTQPITYETKPAHQVEAIQYDGSQQSADAIAAWYANYQIGDVNTIIFPQGNMALESGPILLEIGIGSYVYIDEDGFRVAGKNAFEMYYRLPAGSPG